MVIVWLPDERETEGSAFRQYHSDGGHFPRACPPFPARKHPLLNTHHSLAQFSLARITLQISADAPAEMVDLLLASEKNKGEIMVNDC